MAERRVSQTGSGGEMGGLPAKSDPAVREIVRSWRSLTGGGAGGGARTLVAISAGADSSALALALATAAPAADLVLAHIVHDLRPEAETHADRDAARTLAERLGTPFVESAISVRERTGNDEDNARKARYQALAQLAAEHECRFVATGHHADDALETTLMSLLRGASLRGLAGIPDCRRIAGTQALLVRPMLGASHDDCRRICAECGWAWREDLTNTDTRRLRAALRHAVIPLLVALRPGAAQRVARASQTLHDAAGLVEDAAAELWAMAGSEADPDGAISRVWWARGEMSCRRAVVLGEALRHAVRRMVAGEGLDRVGSRELDRVTRAIRDSSTEPRRFEWARLFVLVDAQTVSIVRKEPDGQ